MPFAMLMHILPFLALRLNFPFSGLYFFAQTLLGFLLSVWSTVTFMNPHYILATPHLPFPSATSVYKSLGPSVSECFLTHWTPFPPHTLSSLAFLLGVLSWLSLYLTFNAGVFAFPMCLAYFRFIISLAYFIPSFGALSRREAYRFRLPFLL